MDLSDDGQYIVLQKNIRATLIESVCVYIHTYIHIDIRKNKVTTVLETCKTNVKSQNSAKPVHTDMNV